MTIFKTGPDFIDPTILERASGAPVYQLDSWMGGAAECRRLLFNAASRSDLILVEGVMGLFDGEPNSADLAAEYGIPVLLVIDAAGMAQTSAALAVGLADYWPSLRVAGAFANRVGSAGHARLLAESLPARMPLYGYLPHAPDVALPERHLGLVLAGEIADLQRRLDAAADLLTAAAPLALPPAVKFARPDDPPRSAQRLDGVRIAVARDAAFAFLYRANLELLGELGARVEFFSPLAHDGLPEADAVYLPGGYPELHLQELTKNTAMRAALHAHNAAGWPILAECGGMLALLESLPDIEGPHTPMFGLMRGSDRQLPRLAALGPREVALPEGSLRGHTFHHTEADIPIEPLAWGESPRGRGKAEPVYRVGRLTASYLHLYLPSNPAACARLFAP